MKNIKQTLLILQQYWRSLVSRLSNTFERKDSQDFCLDEGLGLNQRPFWRWRFKPDSLVSDISINIVNSSVFEYLLSHSVCEKIHYFTHW